MKENKIKKTTTKKSTTKKTSASKKSVGAKKTAVKTTTAKKSTPEKRVISTVSKEEIKKTEVVEPKKETTYNTDLLLRATIIVAYTLIIVILVIGFAETYTKDLKVESSYKPAYLVKEEILKEDNVLTLENARNRLSLLRGDYFVYVGYTKMYNNDVHTLDMGIANLINKYDLKDKFYYLNIDSILNRKNKVDLVNDYLGYRDVLITKVPTIVYVNSENIIRRENIITRDDDKLITVGDFQKLLDINQFVAKK